MAEAVVSMVLESLALLSTELTLSSGRARLTDQILDAQGQLIMIRSLLEDADARQSHVDEVSDWVATIRDAVCDLEDIIESYVLKEASRRNGSWMQIIARGFACVGVVDIGKTGLKIRRIRAQLSDLIDSFINYGIVSRMRPDNESATSVRNNLMSRRTYSHAIERFVVGLEEDVGSLVRHLVGGENSPSVVSVWGMAGVGKTTVAQQVYHHTKIRYHFDCMAWVCLSQEFQSRDVLQEILTKLISATDEQRREFAEMNASEIAELLYNTQQRNKCFVVLDDIWTRDAWDSLKLAFPGEGTKSKILLTTRSEEVALHAAGGEGGFLYKARPLMEQESWILFKQTAFPEPVAHTESIRQKEVLGMKMVERCGGLPLAVIVLAGLLARKNTVEEWLTVSEDVEAYLRGGKYEGKYEEGLIAPISSESAENIEDASYGYLNELVERCMVQVVKHSLTGNIKTIRLHDVMLELCRKMAERENFLYVVNSSEATQTQLAASCNKVPRLAVYLFSILENLLHAVNSSEATETQASIKKVRRLAVHLDGIGHELAPPCDKRHASLRSLLFFVGGHYYSDIHRKLLRSLCRDFKFLKVLKFEDMKAEPEVELPSDIGNLVHLRFLSLKNSEIKRLPSSVANLVCLQTLDLRSVEWVSVKIPNVFWKMAKLRHLYLPLNHRVTEKLSLATLHNLQTLANISSQDCDLKDLIELTDLRKLVLDAREPTEFKTLEEIMISSSITFDHLQSLSLVTGNGNGDIPTLIVLSCPHLLKLQLYGRIKGFPDDDHFSNLIKVTLEETNLQACHIKRLEKLTKLKVLFLRMGALKSETMVFSKEGFPQLEFLSLLGLCELKEWTVEEGAMPRLYSLHIGYCWRLRAVPDGLQHILTLKELTIKRMYHEFCKRLEKGGADFDKFRHASVTITNKR
uniref:probable disease resistance RPP8-like protein 2 isoform X2 n=1 Tax=Fragaria vesca subsp. vesca TaxID=101020 RepID=UPI0005CAB383|nr:PREDICTED: probable disease resistance RPP8-like protein 2 isoform X2 [Fragaria vesca subsp. vesca]